MRVLVISDLHAPYNHKGAIDFLAQCKREYKPEAVVCIGDELDAHGWSRHDRDPDTPGQGDEFALAKQTLGYLFKLFPKCHVCNSNHSQRHLRKAMRVGLPACLMRNLAEALEAPRGWQWSDRWIVDDTLYIHGEGFSGQNAALTAACKHRCNLVMGHVHSWAGIQYHSNVLNAVFGMNVGCLIDQSSKAFTYAKHSQNAATLGCGVVIDGVPHFIPFEGK